jgi:hypothetical protein
MDGETDVEPEILAVDPGDGTAVDPDISDAVETLATKPPQTRSFRRGWEIHRPPIGPSPGVAAQAVLKGVAAVPAVGEAYVPSGPSSSRKPAVTDPLSHELPAAADVVAHPERCLDHWRLW